MNIFVSSTCPIESAQYLDDRRVVKMVLETAQLLSTAVRLAGIDAGYKVTHANHPCSIWTRECSGNYRWVVEHGMALAKEYTARYTKVHKSEAVISEMSKYTHLFTDAPITKFANCTDYKDKPPVLAYQLYLGDKWEKDVRQPTWYGVGAS